MTKLVQFFRQPYIRQLSFLATASLLAYVLCWSSDEFPRLRFGIDKAFAAVFFGITLSAIISVTLTVLCRFDRKAILAQVELLKKYAYPKSPFAVIGTALTRGVAEELLLRASVFAIVSSYSAVAAFVLNAVLSAALHIRSRRHLIISLTKAVEGSILAMLFLWSDSYFLIALARTVSELLTAFALRFDSEIAEKLTELRTGLFDR